MNEPRPQRPFPALLFWALLLPAVVFPIGCVMVALLHWLNPIALSLFVIPMVVAIVAGPIALYLLNHGYGTTRNEILAVVGSIPAVALVGMWIFFEMTHFHI
jgi:uncharacterized membrane protein YeaQ/YmgE (transglycosylase-associated protein family)